MYDFATGIIVDISEELTDLLVWQLVLGNSQANTDDSSELLVVQGPAEVLSMGLEYDVYISADCFNFSPSIETSNPLHNADLIML